MRWVTSHSSEKLNRLFYLVMIVSVGDMELFIALDYDAKVIYNLQIIPEGVV